MSTEPTLLRRRVDRPATLSMGCSLDCERFSNCGGMHRASKGWKCTDRCDSGQCGGDEKCDLVSPAHPDRYARARVEVRGFGFSDLESFRMPLRLPSYISGIAHGSYFRRRVPAYLKWISLPLDRVIQFNDDGWKELFVDGADLRREFHVHPRTRVMLVCVGKDALIEQVWRHLFTRGFVRYFERLQFSAVVVPNFSFFEDEPRTQHYYNRKRSLIVAEEFSRHRIPVIPYFHALEEADFDFWLSFLSARPDIRFLAAEFQTGFKAPDRGRAHLEGLYHLQQALGRPLHIVSVGGVQFRELMTPWFGRQWTLIGSNAFLLAASRLRLEPWARRFRRQRIQLAPGEIFRHNHGLLTAECEGLQRVQDNSELSPIADARSSTTTPSQHHDGH